MRESDGPFGDEPIETESRRLTPSAGLDGGPEPADSANEDFLFHLYRGSELLQDNRVHEAKEELERALHLQPRDSKGQDLLAVVYFRLGLHARAIQIYEQLRRRNANDPALLLNLALCYLKSGQPQAARRDLEHLLTLNPTHARAWGYLGLACERLGDLAAAQHAFQQGGHGQMAKRLAGRRVVSPGEAASEAPPEPSQAVRAVAGAAYRELDAGELSFAIADPTSEKSLDDAAAQSWQPIELGQVDVSARRPPPPAPRAPEGDETRGPDTKDGPQLAYRDATTSLVPSIPQLGLQNVANRRPTLIAPVGAPPAHEHSASEYSAVASIPTHQPPSFTLDDAAIPPRRPVVSVPRPYGAPLSLEGNRTPTLAPPHATPAEATPARKERAFVEPDASHPSAVGGPTTPLGIGPQFSEQVSSTPMTGDGVSHPQSVLFPPATGVELHRSGLALVQTTEELGFATRVEAVRAQQSGFKMQLLERNVKGKPNGESFGGIASPMALVRGAGQLVLSARPGRNLFVFAVRAEMCFAREDVLLGFGEGLAFENGRLATGDGEFVPVVQLKGTGGVVLESIGEVLTLPVHAARSLSVRREVVLGWFGRLVPRALSANDAPLGQRGLVSFAGEGRVLITSG
jgi:hypothetical protein